MALTDCGRIWMARKLHVEWKIKDFFSLPREEGEMWCSPKFRAFNTMWYFQLFPNGDSSSCYSAGYVNLYLKWDEDENSNSCVTITIGMKARDDTVYRSRACTCGLWSNGFVWHEFAEASELLKDRSRLESAGFVTFFCNFLLPEVCVVDVSQQACLDNDLRSLSRDLEKLFRSGHNSDVIIKVRGHDFSAHTPVLATRSPVFASMFSHDMKEKICGTVDIDDCDPDVFKAFLEYVYSGQTENISSDNVIDLYSAAEKYDIQELKVACFEYMKKSMSVDNFCDVMSLAIRYEDSELIDYATTFFLENVEEIIVTTKWISFAKEYHVQANEFFVKTVKHSSFRRI